VGESFTIKLCAIPMVHSETKVCDCSRAEFGTSRKSERNGEDSLAFTERDS
jgi:hypothetical protein